ncbi:MAG: hypothetical protein WDZ44_01360 [Candidatus Spechtbacterales bacterium]
MAGSGGDSKGYKEASMPLDSYLPSENITIAAREKKGISGGDGRMLIKFSFGIKREFLRRRMFKGAIHGKNGRR